MPRGNGPDSKPAAQRITTAAKVARSGVRRYPGELLDSLKRHTRHEKAHPPIAESWPDAPLGASWLGHATTLLRIDGRWVLTDPVFSPRIGLSIGPWTFGVGRRMVGPDERSLPRPDVILLSHAHFDHLDKPTLRRLADKRTHVITARHTRGLVPRGFGSVTEVDWNGEAAIDGLRFRALEPRHWGARTIWDRHRGYNSYVIDAGAHRVLFAGDTAYTETFQEVGASGGTDLTIFGIGAYDPWIENHASPEQVWEMHRHARGRHLLPIHHSTFKLSDEPWDEPMRRLLSAAGEEEPRIVGRRLGDVWVMPPPIGG